MASKVGVILTTQFLTPDNAKFTGYIDYIARENAVRNTNTEKFMVDDVFGNYVDYIGNNRKTTDIFTDEFDELTLDQRTQLKEDFKKAQQKGSLMWQTVISFDNEWLINNGIIDAVNYTVNQEKLKQATRACMKNMLREEGFYIKRDAEKDMKNNFIWSASIHYNTDNLHIHIATVEKEPTREMVTVKKVRVTKDWFVKNKIDIAQYKNKMYYYKPDGSKMVVKSRAKNLVNKMNEIGFDEGLVFGNKFEFDGNDLIIELTSDENNLPPFVILDSVKEEPKGKFKIKTIEKGKSAIVNSLINKEDVQAEINEIIRSKARFLKEDRSLERDNELCPLFNDIYNELVMIAEPSKWFYNNKELEDVINKIDELSTTYMEKYHPQEYEEFLSLLEEMDKTYVQAYGTKEAGKYMKTKHKDLYQRLGNSILSEMRTVYYEGKQKEFEASQPKGEGGGGGKAHATSVHLHPINDFKQAERDFYKAVSRMRMAMMQDVYSYKNMLAYERFEQEREEAVEH